MPRSLIVSLTLVLYACAAPPHVTDGEIEPQADAAPWSGESRGAGDVPDVYIRQWQEAENRASCAIVVPASLGEGEGGVPRAAVFSGGWGVAYDLAGLRSAFGIAGTGVEASAPSYHDWPYSRVWADGSSVGYGPEGGTGPNQLAYLRITGQGCLYNVWSRLGVDHLEFLLGELRFVDGLPPA